MTQFKPDYNRLEKVLTRDGEPDILPLYDYFADTEIIEAVTGKKCDSDSIIKFYYKMGYDYVPVMGYSKLRMDNSISTDDTSELNRGTRKWQDENHGIIGNRADFENYPWPEPGSIDLSGTKEMLSKLPDGMKGIFLPNGGIFEIVTGLMGYVPFSYALYEDEKLVEDLFNRVGELYIGNFKQIVKLDNIRAIVLGDDMGFNSGLLCSPEILRKYCFPRLKELVDITHKANLIFGLHSCGKLDEIMDDLIDYIGIDAKHSYEDKIMNVSEAKRRYGNRIAILGGVDMDFIARRSKEDITRYVKDIIRECAPCGGYALGTGNTIANYIPMENYLEMIRVRDAYGRYPIDISNLSY